MGESLGGGAYFERREGANFLPAYFCQPSLAYASTVGESEGGGRPARVPGGRAARRPARPPRRSAAAWSAAGAGADTPRRPMPARAAVKAAQAPRSPERSEGTPGRESPDEDRRGTATRPRGEMKSLPGPPPAGSSACGTNPAASPELFL